MKGVGKYVSVAIRHSSRKLVLFSDALLVFSYLCAFTQRRRLYKS